MIHVIAVITAKPGERENILAHFRANVPAVRAEKGCIEYGATVDTDGGAFANAAFADPYRVMIRGEALIPEPA